MKNMPKWFTEDEINSWPSEHKKCRKCGEVRPFSMFGPKDGTLFGLDSRCKRCRADKSRKEWSAKPKEKKILDRLRSRSKRYGIDFNLDLEDIVIPNKCPVFNVGFDDSPDFRPSVDRIDPLKGYTKGNICIMSNRANVLKNNATIEELEAVINWLKSNQEEL